MRDLDDIRDEFEFADRDGKWQVLDELGQSLENMPDALKTEATKVQGCSSSVWLYPIVNNDQSLHFLADSNTRITKGIVTLVITTVQDKTPSAILDTDIEALLEPFELTKQLSSKRTQGVPNMIALIRETAARYAQG